jgi:hypothetical protein
MQPGQWAQSATGSALWARAREKDRADGRSQGAARATAAVAASESFKFKSQPTVAPGNLKLEPFTGNHDCRRGHGDRATVIRRAGPRPSR